MKKFLDKNFILETKTAQTLFHKYCENQPIFDFHNHLPPQEIYEDKTLGNLANAWLDHDHYKWRAMRAFGVPENLITGHLNKDGSVKSEYSNDYERYLAFVKTLQSCIGNPLYHWSHLELQRYFGITEAVTEKNARDVWNRCNELLSKKEFTPRSLLEKMNVRELCTTDDPVDNLEYHQKLAKEWKNVKVRPSFRPDNVLSADSPIFKEYIKGLENLAQRKFKNIDDMIDFLGERIDFFKSCGCVVSDHSLENDFFAETTKKDADRILKKAAGGSAISSEELCKYKTYVLTKLGELYAQKGLVMQIHIGALRDNNSILYETVGKNIGEDSLADFNYAAQIGGLLNEIYSRNQDARVILYNLNPKDNEALATMAANFRNCQFGPAWWFNDHKDGIEEQLRVYARTGVFGKYPGMLTDSRSFLSYPRHEYFRRILCNFVGNIVENGEFPSDEKLLGKIVEGICYKNSVEFFRIP